MATQAEKFELAVGLLDDIETRRVDVQQLLLKAARLAKWVGEEELGTYVSWELYGYPLELEARSARALKRSQREAVPGEESTLMNSLSELSIWANEVEANLKASETTAVSSEWALAVANAARRERNQAFPIIRRVRMIEAAVSLPCTIWSPMSMPRSRSAQNRGVSSQPSKQQ